MQRRTLFLPLFLGVFLSTWSVGDVAATPFTPEQETHKVASDGIFKKKKKKDCDCPGNKKNRRKVARDRRRNHTT